MQLPTVHTNAKPRILNRFPNIYIYICLYSFCARHRPRIHPLLLLAILIYTSAHHLDVKLFSAPVLASLPRVQPSRNEKIKQ